MQSFDLTVPTASTVQRTAGRRSYRLLTAACLALALVAATSYLATYRPLTVGSTSGLEGAALVDDGEDGEWYVLTYRDRTIVHGLLSLRNDGRWPVRVTRVGAARHMTGADWHGLVAFRPEANRLNEPDAAGTASSFRPFTLPAGEERAVSVALWIDNCEHSSPGSIATVDAVPVRFTAFGMAHTTHVTLRYPWAVSVPAATCPRAHPPS